MTEIAGSAASDAAYLKPTSFIDSDDPRVIALSRRAVGDATDPIEKAKRLYYTVRDEFLYDPYGVDLSPKGLSASYVIESGNGYCVTKAVLLAAVARAAGIPARLGFADVKNHIATARLIALMGTDVFYYHGYTELFLNGKWVKATPAFNISLCEKFRVKPLEFDGENDSIFHPFDADNRRHMEYVNDRGHRDDLPFEELREAMLRLYPTLPMKGISDGDFAAEAAAENQTVVRVDGSGAARGAK